MDYLDLKSGTKVQQLSIIKAIQRKFMKISHEKR